MKHFVIYIPGLGDRYNKVQRAVLGLWRLFGIHTKFVAMNWDDGQDYESKYHRVCEAIEAAERQGYKVSLVSASAGASMALNVMARCPNLHCVVTVSGAINPRMELSQVTLKRSKAFGVSVRKLATSLPKVDTTRVHTIHGLVDRIVSPRNSVLSGANNHIIPTIGHLLTIASCLTVFSWYIVSLIKHTDL